MIPSRDIAMFSGELNPLGGSNERKRSPNVVWTRTGPSKIYYFKKPTNLNRDVSRKVFGLKNFP